MEGKLDTKGKRNEKGFSWKDIREQSGKVCFLEGMSFDCPYLLIWDFFIRILLDVFDGRLEVGLNKVF